MTSTQDTSLHLSLHFNSHAHVERDICLAYFSFEKIYFNSHAHVERDFIKKLSDEITKISTHTLTWSVTIVHKLKITVENNFNSHAHVERDISKSPMLSSGVNFNSHAHVERDQSASDENGVNAISTHTLTWSVTIVTLLQSALRQISTHTLTWSVT